MSEPHWIKCTARYSEDSPWCPGELHGWAVLAETHDEALRIARDVAIGSCYATWGTQTMDNAELHSPADYRMQFRDGWSIVRGTTIHDAMAIATAQQFHDLPFMNCAEIISAPYRLW